MALFTFIGLIGATGYVLAFVLLQLMKIDGNGVRFTVLNVMSALCVLVSLADQFNLAAAVVQVVTISLGIVGLVSRNRKRNGAPSHLSAIEEITADFPNAFEEIIDLRDGAEHRVDQHAAEQHKAEQHTAEQHSAALRGVVQYSLLPSECEIKLRQLEFHVAQRHEATQRVPLLFDHSH